jgi:glycosyltransferase involved in cell wall biosynthesis
MPVQKIILDCERMKYLHTGLYHFCHQLGLALQAQVDPAKEALSFFVPEKEEKAFGNDASIIRQHSLQKFVLPSVKGYKVWHSTYQSSHYFPANKKIRIVLTIHDLNFLYDDNKQAFKKERELKNLQQKIDRADHVVAISNFTLSDVATHLDINKKKVSVIYNGCNFATVSTLQSPANIPSGQFLYSIGTIAEKKNFHVLPSLLVGNDRQLIISGIVQSQVYYDRIIEEAKKIGVADRVILTGPVTENDKQWYMQHCEAFVFPSLAEGFGLPVIEAMHFGKPVFLSTLTALPEIGGNYAYYFQNFEPAAMRKVLEDGLRSYKTIGDPAAIKAWAEHFNWSNAAKQYIEVYRSLY